MDNLKTRTTRNVNISVFVVYIEAIIYLLIYNLHDGNFNSDTEVLT